MSNGRLTIWIGGREALPVRAIPYAGNWEKVSPAWVARYLAQGDGFSRGCVPLTAYHIPDDIPAPVQPREWNAAVANLEGYEAEVKQQHSNDAIGYAAWRQGAAEKLPAGVFVWLDEFEQVYRNHCERNYLGTDELILAPMLDETTRAMMHEGFGPRKLHAANNPQTDEMKRAHLIGWYDYTMKAAMWLKRASVKSNEAAMLLCRIDPLSKKDPERIFVDDDKASPDRYRLLRRVFLDVAEADPQPRTLLDWRDVAKREGMRYHEWIDEYVQARGEELPADAGSKGDVVTVDTGATAVGDPNIPGKLPRVAIGRLAVTAAWQIERESRRAATADKVIERLQAWATGGQYPDILLRAEPRKRAVIWMPKKTGKEKDYDAGACGKTLEEWRKSRA